MNRSKIEWTNYTINPIKGMCPMACPYCYARAMYKRFKWNPEIRFEPEVFIDAATIRKSSRIFVGSTMELFGDWIPAKWMQQILQLTMAGAIKHHTFIFLTKQPQNLAKFSPFPPNCYVGVSVDGTDNAPLGRMIYTGFDRVDAMMKFISFEPLLARTRLDPRDLGWAKVGWVIIGAQTNPYCPPKIEWVDEIVEAATKAGIPVFLKNNLESLLPTPFTADTDTTKIMPFHRRRADGCWRLRQEVPE